MRIVAGELRGRRISAPAGVETRPTSDRVREALFSSLTARLGTLDGACVLDAFAGSGALGIEALSRGASSATFVESARPALSALDANVGFLGIANRTRIVRGDVFALARRGALPGGPFTLLFLDPPYRINKFEVRRLIEDMLDASLVTREALVVWEHASNTDADWPDRCAELGARKYGSTTISIAGCDAEGEGR
ncbi:MAG: 16S rRNA (guanine(966)-N(2))-methyltransferase RsmD [Actinomycetota bacterium]|nr:16S rRNA (guanine(966)-N(2))-methyltransferase RsmD [Actinomycetota bacterium]